jgi:hypothetical protein
MANTADAARKTNSRPIGLRHSTRRTLRREHSKTPYEDRITDEVGSFHSWFQLYCDTQILNATTDAKSSSERVSNEWLTAGTSLSLA